MPTFTFCTRLTRRSPKLRENQFRFAIFMAFLVFNFTRSLLFLVSWYSHSFTQTLQDIMDITRNPYHQKVKTKQMKGNFRRQFPNHAVNYARQPYLLRQKEVGLDLLWNWIPLELISRRVFLPRRILCNWVISDLLVKLFRCFSQVHEEFAWYPLEEAAVLTPICKYIMTTDGFRTFAKLPPIVKEEIKPVPVANTDSPMRPGGRRGRRWDFMDEADSSNFESKNHYVKRLSYINSS